MGEMTTKPPSGLAASGPAEDPEADQITKEHEDDADDITVDPSADVTVEATEDVTIEADSRTPHPTLRGGGTPAPLTGQRAPTLLGVPVHSLPLPGVTASSASGVSMDDETRSISYDEEITVLAPSAPASDPLAVLDALDRPSITDDDEEETKVEPAEAAMKAAETLDDVTTALSAQASLEREKALRRSAPPAASNHGDDLEFADPEAEDEEEESLDDELDDDDEVISAGGAIEEEEDDLGQDDDGPGDGVATATFMKPADSTGLSGLLNPRRPPTGGRDGFGSRLPTPYPPPQTTIPAPSTSPFASRLGPAPMGTPYSGRPTGAAMPALQVPPPSGKATTETEPGFFVGALSLPKWMFMLVCAGVFILGFGVRGFFGGKSTPTGPTVIVAKPTAAPAAPVLEPVQANPTTPPTEATAAKPTTPPTEAAAKPAAPGPTVTDIPVPPSDNSDNGTEAGLWKPATKKPAVPRTHKVAAADSGEESLLKPKPAVDKSPKPAAPKVAVEKAPKPAAPPAAAKPAPAAKPGKKAAKVWVDPFAN